ncbi:alpha/beta hydrolase fold domain-containing protein [Hellea balneolensis]|uniref:alpha/beta hydrolase fold domain-containing protein n=1 Tax=Hellea balneolensis TaxID=287478 RepID=UPI0004203242|nr:alpha/beta hydrolase [Hellea balneolensis]
MTTISFRHRTFINILRLIGGRKILAKQFERGKGNTAAPTKGQRKRYNIDRTEFRGQPVWSYAGNDTLIYYIHGGGFVAGFSYFYFPMMGKIAQQAGATLTAPDYPLFPNIDAPGTHDWIRAHYDETIKQLNPSKVVLMGDSAGANAAMVLAQSLIKSKTPADKLVMLSPWIDLRMVHPDMVQHDEEQLLDGSKVHLAAERHAGELSLEDPLISPIFGDLASLPPTWVFTADKDLLHPDIMSSVEKMRAAGLTPALDLAEGLAHVYMLLPTPEGKAGLSRIAEAARFS